MAIRELANRFLTAKKLLVDADELEPRRLTDYFQTCQRVIAEFGPDRLVADLRGEDFQGLRASYANRGPVTRGNEIQRVRILFKFASDAELIEKPVKYGTSFKRPSKSVLPKARNKKGKRMFAAAQLRDILDAAGMSLRAMILLAINAAYGNTDVGTLPKSAIDLETGWAVYPRPKTGIERRCPIWPETAAAIEEAVATRPKATDQADEPLVFLTKRRQSWCKRARHRVIVDTLIDAPSGTRPTVIAVPTRFTRLAIRRSTSWVVPATRR